MQKKLLLICLMLLTLSACGGIEWFPDNTTPDPFSFTAKTDVAVSTVVESDSITITGNTYPAQIKITNGEYSIDGGTFTTAEGTINAGQTVVVRHTSAATPATDMQTDLTIGGITAPFISTTAASLITTDPTGTIEATSVEFSEPFRDTTTSTQSIQIELTNNGTTDHTAKVTVTAKDPGNSIDYTNSYTTPAIAPGEFYTIDETPGFPIVTKPNITWRISAIELLQ